MVDRLKIERRGGFTGLPARGEVETASLSAADLASVEALFRRKTPPPPSPGADRFTFRLSRHRESGVQTMDVPEHLLPAALAVAVKEELP